MPRRDVVENERENEREWMGLTEAAARLSISPSTLRRWADEGAVRTFTTPGGHRRFWRPAIEGLVPGERASAPHPEVLGESERSRMTRIYRNAVGRDVWTNVPWAADLNADERKSFRNHGRRIVADMLAALDTAAPEVREQRIAEAREAAESYGRAAASMGIATSDIADAFLRFGRPFMAELSAMARRRGLDAATTTDVLDRSRESFDRLLVAMLRAYEAVSPGHRAPAIEGSRSSEETPDVLSPAGESGPVGTGR